MKNISRVIKPPPEAIFFLKKRGNDMKLIFVEFVLLIE